MTPEIMGPEKPDWDQSHLFQFVIPESVSGRDFAVKEAAEGWQLNFIGPKGLDLASAFADGLDRRLKYGFTEESESNQSSHSPKEIQEIADGGGFSLNFTIGEITGVTAEKYIVGTRVPFLRFYFRFSNRHVLVDTINAIGTALSQQAPERIRVPSSD